MCQLLANTSIKSGKLSKNISTALIFLDINKYLHKSKRWKTKHFRDFFYLRKLFNKILTILMIQKEKKVFCLNLKSIPFIQWLGICSNIVTNVAPNITQKLFVDNINIKIIYNIWTTIRDCLRLIVLYSRVSATIKGINAQFKTKQRMNYVYCQRINYEEKQKYKK